ncbi:MAG: hypothetical protein EOO40_00240 [Deltaproteobacteria bacterium]|nr:MAG: hypothetical protein EOO40_00240 [Deltaproteobacteria bacterium]
MRHDIKKAADLDVLLGKKIAKVIKTFGGGMMKRLPGAVYVVREKPKFYLDDGGTLRAYGLDIAAGKLTGEKYLGCADTAINNMAGQFTEGHHAPAGHAMLFVESFWNGRNHSWTLTIVTDAVAQQIAA